MTGGADPAQHRDLVRCEFYQALGGDIRRGFNVEHATMVRNERYKLVVYHGHEPGELFDLQEDPGEFVNLWDDPTHAAVRYTLMKRNLDSLALAIDLGPEQVAGS